MATQPGLYQSPAASSKDWLSRNWKWVIPVALLVIALCVVAFIGAILLIVETSFQHSDCYIQALTRATASPQVIEKIGQPLKAAWLASGSINISGPTGNADISIPVSGPRGKGTLYVVAKKNAGKWNFETLQVEIEGQSERIDLLKSEVPLPTEN